MVDFVRPLFGGSTSSAEEPFKAITPQPTTNPQGADVVLGGSADGLMIYMDGAVDLSVHDGAHLMLAIREGANLTTLGACWRQAYAYKAYNAGASLSLGLVDAYGTPVERSLKVAPMAIPASLTTLPATVVSASLFPDWFPVHYWTPTDVQLVLPAAGSWFWIDHTASTVQRMVAMAERSPDGDWGPARVIVLPPGRMVPVFALHAEVAFCWPDAAEMALRLPVGSEVNYASYVRPWNPSRDFPISRTVTVADATAFSNWMSDKQAGDDVVFTGSMTLGSVSISSFAGPLRFRTPDWTDPTAITIEASWLIDGPSASFRCDMEGFTAENHAATNRATLELRRGQFTCQHMISKRVGGTANEPVRMDAQGVASTYKMFNVDAQGNGTNTTDVWAGHTTNSGAYAVAEMIGCKGSSPGAGAQENLITPHFKFRMFTYGGTYTNPGGGPAIVGSDALTQIMLVGTQVSKGSGSAVVIGGAAAIDVISFGSDLSGFEGAASLAVRVAVGTRLRTALGNTHLYPVHGLCLWYIGTRWEAASGGGFTPETPNYAFIGCHASGTGYWSIRTRSGGGVAPQRLWNNTFTINAGYSREADPSLSEVLFNLFTGALTATSSSTKNVLCDGNIGTNFGGATGITSNSNRNTVSPLAQLTGSPTGGGYEADGVTPLSTSNLFWDHANFAGGLSGGSLGSDANTLRDRLAVGAGFMDPFGRSLYLGRKICRGAYGRQFVDSTNRLYPTVA